MVQSLIFRVIAILYIAFVFLTSAFFFVIALAIWLATVLFDKRLWLLHRFTCLWASLYIWLMPPWSVSIQGKEHIDANETYIIVSNHQSLVDILVAFTLFTHFKWVSKAELFKIPLIGWNMSLNRYIRLRRGSNKSVKTMYKACEKHLKQVHYHKQIPISNHIEAISRKQTLFTLILKTSTKQRVTCLVYLQLALFGLNTCKRQLT